MSIFYKKLNIYDDMNNLPDDILRCIFAELPHSAKIQYIKAHRRIYIGIAKQAGFCPWRPGMRYYSLADISPGEYVTSVHFLPNISRANLRIITSAGMPINPYLSVETKIAVLSYNDISRRAIASTSCPRVQNIMAILNSPYFVRAVMREYTIKFHVGVFMWSLPGHTNTIEFATKKPVVVGQVCGRVCINTIRRYSYMDVFLQIV